MTAHNQENPLHFDQAGSGPAILFLHDDPARQETLFRDCAPLTASNLRVVVAMSTSTGNSSAQVITLLKQLGVGRAVVVAIGRANHTLIDLLERHPDRIAAASFVADRTLARELHASTANPEIHALLRSRRQPSIATAVAKARQPATAYGAVQSWAARMVESCRTGIRNCSALLASLELPGLIQLDDDGDDEEVVSDTP